MAIASWLTGEKLFTGNSMGLLGIVHTERKQMWKSTCCIDDCCQSLRMQQSQFNWNSFGTWIRLKSISGSDSNGEGHVNRKVILGDFSDTIHNGWHTKWKKNVFIVISHFPSFSVKMSVGYFRHNRLLITYDTLISLNPINYVSK